MARRAAPIARVRLQVNRGRAFEAEVEAEAEAEGEYEAETGGGCAPIVGRVARSQADANMLQTLLEGITTLIAGEGLHGRVRAICPAMLGGIISGPSRVGCKAVAEGGSMNRPLNVSRTPVSAPEAGLVSLSYRSHAAAPMTDEGLHELEQAADARNRSEGVTGVMLHDDGHFFQWLEGPVEGVTRVWSSVQRDRRHGDIRVNGIGPVAGRVFNDHGMKLLRPGDPVWSASALLATTLPHLIESVVIPALAARQQKQVLALPAIDPRVAELASLLIAADPTAASRLARELSRLAGPLAFARASLFDPTAQSLGDLWYDDNCTGVELDLALVRLQKIIRELGEGALPDKPKRFAVLVAPEPGETHMLGAALDSELLWRAGWNTHTEYPATDDALHALVAGEWFDALDLSLSAALRREESVPRLERTIASARVASRNPALIVVVGGRVFTERDNLAASVGADVNASRTLELGASIEEALHRPRSTERRKESAESIGKRREKSGRSR